MLEELRDGRKLTLERDLYGMGKRPAGAWLRCTQALTATNGTSITVARNVLERTLAGLRHVLLPSVRYDPLGQRPDQSPAQLGLCDPGDRVPMSDPHDEPGPGDRRPPCRSQEPRLVCLRRDRIATLSICFVQALSFRRSDC
jgi:hypothetical protein